MRVARPRQAVLVPSTQATAGCGDESSMNLPLLAFSLDYAVLYMVLFAAFVSKAKHALSKGTLKQSSKEGKKRVFKSSSSLDVVFHDNYATRNEEHEPHE